MRIHEEIISSEMRSKIKNDVLPEAIRFTKSVFPCIEAYDVDKLDRIVVEDSVEVDDLHTLFTLEYDPCLNLCTVKCSFCALSADNDWCTCTCEARKDKAPACNDDILAAMREALSCENYQDFEISYGETKGYDDEPFKRTMWTARASFLIEDDLYTNFMQAYRKILCVIKLIYEVYETYAIETDLVSSYQEGMERAGNESEVFDIELTVPVFARGKLMDEYESRLIDGFCSLRRIYNTVGPDITSTEITVEMVKARNPSVFITSETLLEEDDGNLDPDDFDYRQSFSIGEPKGDSRSIFHGNDIVARFFFVSPDIYVLEPLSIYFEDDITKYLVVIKETDGSISLFTDAKDEIAVLYRDEDNYHAAIKYRLREMAPFIVAVEELIFEPNQKKDCGKAHDEENCFRSMNKKIDMAKEKLKDWFKDDDWRAILRDPALNLFSYITRVNYCEGNLTGEKMTHAEVFQVQDIKNRSLGIDSGKNPAEHNINGLKGEQIRLFDC